MEHTDKTSQGGKAVDAHRSSACPLGCRGAGMVRSVYDKRTLRRMYRVSFEGGLSKYAEEAGIQLKDVSEYSYGGGGLRVIARKRPLFDHEAQTGEFDVLKVTKEGMVVHSCAMKADLRQPLLATHFCPGGSASLAVPIRAGSGSSGVGAAIRANHAAGPPPEQCGMCRTAPRGRAHPEGRLRACTA